MILWSRVRTYLFTITTATVFFFTGSRDFSRCLTQMIYTIEYFVGPRVASGGWNQGTFPRQTPSQSSVFWYQLEIWLNVISVKVSRQSDGECFSGQHVNDNWNNLTQSTNKNFSLKTNNLLWNNKFPLFMEPRDYGVLYTLWYCCLFLILSFHLFLGLPSCLIKLE